MRTEVIFEDNDIFVIYKPAGLATQTAKATEMDVVSELKNYLRKKSGVSNPYLGVIHRLDQPVEGLLVFAKNPKSAAALTKNLGDNTLNKQYLAVCCGKRDENKATLVDYLLQKDKNCAQVTENTDDPDAKRAELTYEVLETLKEASKVLTEEKQKEISLVSVVIKSGRFHQIRVQMSHAGMPLLGDQKYGTEESLEVSRELFVRTVALCANKIEVVHPMTHKKLSFSVKPKGKAFSYFHQV